LALVILLQTDEGQAILQDEFSPGFDERRKSRVAQFSGYQNNEDEEGGEPEGEIDEEDKIEPVDNDVEVDNVARRDSVFLPTWRNICHVCAQMRKRDLSFLLEDVFSANLLTRHILECLKVRLGDNHHITLPPGALDLPPFGERCPHLKPTPFLSALQLIKTFVVDGGTDDAPPGG
jgi:hypothetical protein